MSAKFAPPGLALPPYAPDGLCPKCANDDIGTFHYPDGCDDPKCWSHDREHLRRNCRNCRYEWAESAAPVTLLSPSRADNWKAAYELKVNDLTAETLRTSRLIGAMHDMGHRSVLVHTRCAGCQALREVGALDPVEPIAAVTS